MGIYKFAVGIGITTSILIGATPKLPQFSELANKSTFFALRDLITKVVLKSGNLGDMIESVLISGLRFYSEEFDLKFLEKINLTIDLFY